MYEIASIVLLNILALIIYKFSFKNSIFEVSFTKGSYPGFFFLYNFLVFIIPSSLLLNIYPIEHFWVAFKVEPEIIFSVSLYIIISFIFLILFIFLIGRLSEKYFEFNVPTISTRDSVIYRNFVFYSLLFSISLIALCWLFLDVKHVFFESITLNQSISTARYEIAENKYTTFIKYFLHVLASLLTVIVASPVYEKRFFYRILFITLVFYIVSWGGHKGELFNIFFIYFFTFATFTRYKFNFINFMKAFLLLLILMYLIYRVVILQYADNSDLTIFLDYFYQRVFVAQMIGVYEEFSLNIQNIAYLLHGVPFASLFTDVPIFHKDLMMITEDRTDPSSIGIKNTYFIAEAYAMGGWVMIWLSVLIYAINFLITFIIFVSLFNKFFTNNMAFNKLIVCFFLFSFISVTGGFSDLVFFKITILLIILFVPIFIMAYISRYKIRFTSIN